MARFFIIWAAEVFVSEDTLYARPGLTGSLVDGQLLEDHLQGVADRCATFCRAFESEEWGRLAGLLHDLGKVQDSFQARLKGERVQVEHSSAGAALAFETNQELGTPLAFTIAGHHTGLANMAGSEAGQPAPLKKRLETGKQILDDVRRIVQSFVPDLEFPEVPSFLGPLQGSSQVETQRIRRQYEFWIRFMFSALVDSDRLDAADFGQPEEKRERAGFDSLKILRGRLDQYIDSLVAAIPSGDLLNRVNRARASILDSCCVASTQKQGIFSLTVPTGGGKTLSAMSFALSHAVFHGLRRVIVVIPYTSIIEQNAAVYRLALGKENVVEHHSSLDPQRRIQEVGEEISSDHEMACENWDAPVIVTTSVQFFETLFSNRASRCRKLHNVARSVIILDEVQTLPPGFLEPLLEAVQELVNSYGCSIVLSTATPPALVSRDGGLRSGLKEVKPIIKEAASLSASLKRVAYHWHPLDKPPIVVEELAQELLEHERVLAVVHSRADARNIAIRIAELSKSKTVEHLSALMCPAHRIQTIGRIQQRLKASDPCRVVSTQLVEAGVDLDFPVVYRAMGGLDSIAQAAGRCNREGRMDTGDVHVFLAESKPPTGTPRRGLEVTRSMLYSVPGGLDMVNPSVFDEFFRALYLAEDLDSKGIQALRQQFDFATVSDRFRLIEDGFTQSVVVQYGEGNKRLEQVNKLGPSKDRLRGLQPFLVSVYPKAFAQLLDQGAIDEILPGLFALARGFEHLYDEKFGLVPADLRGPEPDRFIV
jgi:CRISPR-associated endonuclease/helicase Cas3